MLTREPEAVRLGHQAKVVFDAMYKLGKAYDRHKVKQPMKAFLRLSNEFKALVAACPQGDMGIFESYFVGYYESRKRAWAREYLVNVKISMVRQKLITANR